MKILLRAFCFLYFPLIVYSQTLNVHKNDGTYQSFRVNEIDSVTFTTGLNGGIPCPGIPTINYAGKTYNTVQIGTPLGPQCWLKENLDVGTMILGTQNQTNNGMLEKYCYNNDPNNCTTYGGLYQWNEAMQYVTTQGAQGICPTGWHIPTLAEFQLLAAAVNYDGRALKRQDQGSGGGIGSNTSGFSALLAGHRFNNTGTFVYLGVYLYFWSSTKPNDYDAQVHMLNMNDNLTYIGLSTMHKEDGMSVRCLKN